MVKVKYTNTDGKVNIPQIKSAISKMKELLDILDAMNEHTFGTFDDNCSGDVYTTVADSIQSVTDGLLHGEPR